MAKLTDRRLEGKEDKPPDVITDSNDVVTVGNKDDIVGNDDGFNVIVIIATPTLKGNKSVRSCDPLLGNIPIASEDARWSNTIDLICYRIFSLLRNIKNSTPLPSTILRTFNIPYNNIIICSYLNYYIL